MWPLSYCFALRAFSTILVQWLARWTLNPETPEMALKANGDFESGFENVFCVLLRWLAGHDK